MHSLKPGPEGTASSESPRTAEMVVKKDPWIQALCFMLL